MRRRTLICSIVSGVSLLSALAVGGVVYQPPKPTHARGPEVEQLPWDVCFSPGGRCTQGVVNAPKAANTPEVCFRPQQNCEARVLQEIAQAQERILVQAFRLTSVPIAQGLIAAQARGVYVAVILEKSQSLQDPAVQRLLASPIPVFQDARHKIAHSKIMLIDQRILTGSYNWTHNAQCCNAENLLILIATLLPEYEQNWTFHLCHATPLPADSCTDAQRPWPIEKGGRGKTSTLPSR